MAFRGAVRGLARLPYAEDGSGSSAGAVDLVGMAGLGTRACQGWEELVECPGPDAGIATFSLSLASIPFNTSGDYFAISVAIDGPSLGGRNCKPVAGPTDNPCHFAGDSLYDGTVDGNFIRSLGGGDPGYEVVATDYHADTTQPNSELFSSHTSWPGSTVNNLPFSPFNRGYLVNSSPVWPTPDVVNNNFGMVLFTLAQLPAAIETTISYFSYDQHQDGQLHVSVFVYNETTPLPGDVLYGDVAGFV